MTTDSTGCPVCGETKNAKRAIQASGSFRFDCERCGKFILTDIAEARLPHLLKSPTDAPKRLSHALRRAQLSNKVPVFGSDAIERMVQRPLPRPREQADLLVWWIGENSGALAEEVEVAERTHGSLIGSKSPEAFDMVIKHLVESHLVEKKLGRGCWELTLTFGGWDRYEELKLGRTFTRRGFMAMKFGEHDLDRVFEESFKPAALQAGFTLQKLDENPKAGLIDDRLRVEIRSCDFLVADLTHANPGAYWEAGYAEGLGKPVIYTCKKSHFDEHKTHFDTNHHLTVTWDLDNMKEAAGSLKATIRATLPALAKQTDDEGAA